ncbi:MAG: prepilin-type N-terminal cleavage/methylation domain-containing protein [Fibrobacterota bacterium]|nr:prepilin-type N-terminal cleavage/methylation domain-containing protein [Chitinispirillaceae bacterium]
MNSRGVTLIELIIYIVIAAIVVALMAVPFRKMVTSTKTEKQESSLQTNSRDALAVMSREIRNTGFKRYIVDASGTFNPAVIPKTFVAADSSSFILKQGNKSDTLTIYKATLDGSGYSTGGVDSVKYYLKDSSLIRDANTVTTELANDVHALQFRLGRLSKDSLLFRADTFYTGSNGWDDGGEAKSTVVSPDLNIEYKQAGTGTVTSKNTFTVPRASKLRFVFTLSNNSNVETDIDSLKWSVLNSAGTEVAYDYFMPGITSGNLIVTCKTSVSNAKVRFSAKCKGAASLTLRLIEVRTADIGAIAWSDTVAVKDKKNVKALRIYTLQRSSSKAESYASDTVSIANITVNRSTNYAWRLLSETVEIPNNGLF